LAVVKINGNRGAQQETLFQQKFQKKLYYFNRNSQFRTVMQMIQLDIRSRTKNPTPSVVRNPTPTPPKNLRLLTTPTPQPS